jgi:hypothetical protein
MLTSDLQNEEVKRMEVWAEAMRSLNAADENTDLNLVLKVINGNNTIPVIVMDNYGNVQTHRNLNKVFEQEEDSMLYLQDLAENMKKSGGFVPGIRPGEPTAVYIQKVLERVTLGGALFVACIAVLPDYLRTMMSALFFFGGTSLLIVVGVSLDTIGQIESHLIMRHYEGFMKEGRIKGRWFNIK